MNRRDLRSVTAALSNRAAFHFETVLDRMASIVQIHEHLTDGERATYREAIARSPNGGAMHEDGMRAVRAMRRGKKATASRTLREAFVKAGA